MSAVLEEDLAGLASPRASGLLIVNADDWGGFPGATDAIERCFEAGAISSTTAMVHMSDSARAAEMAVANGRPVGLHLNLTQPFEDRDAPPEVLERQARVCAHFSNLRLRRWTYDRRRSIKQLVALAIEDQLEGFRRLYDREPTHLDSHHHVHVCPDVFLSPAILPSLKVRQTISPAPGLGGRERIQIGTVPRRSRHVALRRRFTTTDRFWFGPDLIPELGGSGLEAAIAEAADRPVEIMVHPSFTDELDALLAQPWLTAIADAPLGSYRDLPPVG